MHLQEPRWSPTPVPALAGATLLRSGQHHTLALMRTGAVLSAGRPTYGRLGRSGVDPASDDPRPEANSVEGLDGAQVSSLAAGGRQPAFTSVPPSTSRCHGCLNNCSVSLRAAAHVHVLQTWLCVCLSVGHRA